MSSGHSELAIEVLVGPDVDDERLAGLTSRLRAELLDLEVEAVAPAAADQAPMDAKGLGLLAIGGLIVRFALRPSALRAIVSGVRSWAERQHGCSVKLTLDGDSCEVTGQPSAEQVRLIELWIARHAGPR